MRNPLIDSIYAISKAGYSINKEEKASRITLEQPYANQKLTSLASFLLSQYHPVSVTCTNPLKKRLCIGMSGGLDSYCAFIKAAQSSFYEEVTLLFHNYGQPFYKEEESVVTEIRGAIAGATNPFKADTDRLAYLKGPKINWVTVHTNLVPQGQDISDFENYIVPARNLVIAAECSNYGNTVWIVANRRSNEGVGTRDKTSRFYNSASDIFSEFYGFQVTVESPFFTQSKLQMVQNHLAEGWSKDALVATFSCYAKPDPTSDIKACGKCGACWKKWRLLEELGIEYKFRSHPKDGPEADKFRDAEARKRG